VALGLWDLGYRNLTGFDFAGELLDQARSLAAVRGAGAVTFVEADATRLERSAWAFPQLFGGAAFMFNGLMQIPGRRLRRRALRGLRRLCAPGAPLVFTTHDRDASPREREHWGREALLWKRGGQDPRLIQFGDRYFEDESGRTFMHLPDRPEILEDLAATGWTHEFDAMRAELARESQPVREFSDECRFWVARRPAVSFQTEATDRPRRRNRIPARAAAPPISNAHVEGSGTGVKLTKRSLPDWDAKK
jgi:SAM-dependent methyltransferase